MSCGGIAVDVTGAEERGEFPMFRLVLPPVAWAAGSAAPTAGRVGRTAGMMLVAMTMAAHAQATVLEIGDDGIVRTRSADPALGWTVPGEAEAMGAESPATVVTGAPERSPSTNVIVDVERRLANIPAALVPAVEAAARKYDLSPSLIDAVARQESGYRVDAVSRVGAIGVMQLMPGTARMLGVDPHDPFQNIDGGARYLRLQLNRFNGDVERALAAYNAGPGRVERAGGVPRIAETQDYVRRILGRLGGGKGTVAGPAPAVIQIAQASGEM
jgi:soluble lytic murein transglycosylase-like protein